MLKPRGTKTALGAVTLLAAGVVGGVTAIVLTGDPEQPPNIVRDVSVTESATPTPTVEPTSASPTTPAPAPTTTAQEPTMNPEPPPAEPQPSDPQQMRPDPATKPKPPTPKPPPAYPTAVPR